jgi:cellulose synthase/poly-beta-1,6-N-acetylglucosamine synthase-like glycosyltransferase
LPFTYGFIVLYARPWDRETIELALVLNQPRKFTIGISASDRADNLRKLIDIIEAERFLKDYALEKIIIVASGFSEASLTTVHQIAMLDSRILLIEEKTRRGKSEAINIIIQNAAGSYLIFINSDATPSRGAISELLRSIDQAGENVGVASARPSFPLRGGLTSLLEDLMWSVHNECSLRLNHMNLSNHGSDEMMAVRMNLLQRLPQGLVNDGAYIAGRARLRGYSIKFCSEASVQIDVPRRIVDLIRQRRRIIFGHFQVWRLTGRSPKTVESLFLLTPKFSMSLIVRMVARSPRLIKILPLALVSEGLSVLLGMRDTISSTRRHEVWDRYGN